MPETGLTARVKDLATRPLPAPPDTLRRGPFASGAFSSRLRSERVTAQLGIWLGISFGICFLTGLLSHGIQHDSWWLSWPTRPVNLYRVTQGVHVATGLAAIPLLLAKLWSVYPKFFTWPPVRDAVHGVSRAGILLLVGSAIFQLTTGLLNIARWYAPMPFFFTTAHYWTAWIAVGAICVHIGSRLPAIRSALRRPTEPAVMASPDGGLSRRGFLATVAAAMGVVTLSTVGQTVSPLSRISLLAPRVPADGPQGLPVNKSARSAGVTELAADPAYTLIVHGGQRIALTLTELRALRQHTVSLPIACVEGWSADATWTGVRLADLLELAEWPDGAEVDVESMQPSGLYRASTLPSAAARDPLTLVALRLNGETLHLDHGYPARLIAPNRPGVLQTKWLSSLTASAS